MALTDLRDALTFDDVLLVPQYSEVLPRDVDVRSRLTRNIELAVPLFSAAMDSVTEARTAITMAREGGIGIIHKNLPPEDQALEVQKVKRAESGMVLSPITVRPTESLRDVLALMREHDISGVPVVEGDTPVGILTARDIRFERNLDQPVSALMTKELVTVQPGVTAEAAKQLLHQHRIEKLLVVERRKARRAHHDQGHPPGRSQPASHQGQQGASPGRCRDWPRSRSRRARRGARCSGRRCHRGRHGARALEGRHRRGAGDEEGTSRRST